MIGGLFAVVVLALVVAGVSQNRTAPSTASHPTPATSHQVYHPPPQDFRGIKWGDPLPQKRRLQETVLRGCSAIIEQKLLRDTPTRSHTHIETDDMDLFGQPQNVPPFFGVRVSSQLFVWSEKQFWAGHIFIYNYSDIELTTLRTVLVEKFGHPQITRMDQWLWRNPKIQILLMYNPVPKPSLDRNLPPATSIELIMGKFD
jgi:hypothetical protein